jgi:hypothetical protein
MILMPSIKGIGIRYLAQWQTFTVNMGNKKGVCAKSAVDGVHNFFHLAENVGLCAIAVIGVSWLLWLVDKLITWLKEDV